MIKIVRIVPATTFNKVSRNLLFFEKGKKFPEGTVRIWNDKKYRKQGKVWKYVGDVENHFTVRITSVYGKAALYSFENKEQAEQFINKKIRGKLTSVQDITLIDNSKDVRSDDRDKVVYDVFDKKVVKESKTFEDVLFEKLDFKKVKQIKEKISDLGFAYTLKMNLEDILSEVEKDKLDFSERIYDLKNMSESDIYKKYGTEIRDWQNLGPIDIERSAPVRTIGNWISRKLLESEAGEERAIQFVELLNKLKVIRKSVKESKVSHSDITKSLVILLKGKKFSVGTIREWGGKKYRKNTDGKWVLVSERKVKGKYFEFDSEKSFVGFHGECDYKKIQGRLREFEKSNKNKYVESMVALDKHGGELLFKKGTSRSVILNQEEIISMTGAMVVTHNHPSGNSFSCEDVLFAVLNNVKEIRAFGISNRKFVSYSLRIPNLNFNSLEERKKFCKKIQSAYNNGDVGASYEVGPRFRKGEFTVEEANSLHSHLTMEYVANVLGFIYNRGESK